MRLVSLWDILLFFLVFLYVMCYHVQKHYISSMFYLKRQYCLYQKFYYIQENLNAFNSLLTAERS